MEVGFAALSLFCVFAFCFFRSLPYLTLPPCALFTFARSPLRLPLLLFCRLLLLLLAFCSAGLQTARVLSPCSESAHATIFIFCFSFFRVAPTASRLDSY